jgi:hypothetical protein
MSNFFDEQGRTRVYGEAYMMYVAAEKPPERRSLEKGPFNGWTLDSTKLILPQRIPFSDFKGCYPKGP